MIRWLTRREEHVWRTLLHTHRLLDRGMERQIHEASNISSSDFAVLVHVTDAPDGRLRISKLARALQWERSRLSHHLNRMVKRGLITKEADDDDARGSWAVVTPHGREVLGQAAPPHVEWVRTFVIDVLTAEEVDQFGRILDKLEASLHEADTL